MSIEGQGHFLTLAKAIYIWKLKLAFLRNHLANQSQILYVSFSGTRKWKFIDMMVGTLPRWPPCPYMVKTLQKSSSLGGGGGGGVGADFHEAWHVVSGPPAHHSLFKWWPWVDLDLFYGKVKFGNLGFSIGKSENCWFFRTFAAFDLKPTEKMNICEYWRSKSFLDLGRSFTYKT